MDEKDDQFLLKSGERHRGLRRLSQNRKAKIKHQNVSLDVITIFFQKDFLHEKEKENTC